ncbi:MAG: hypothetical protein ACPHVV_04100 [Porticoccaceae bacterium]
MLMQNFASYLRGPATSVRRSVCDLIGYLQALKYMPVLICMALFFTSNSHSFNGLIEHASSSTQGSYKASLQIYNPDLAILNFSGNTPRSLDGYDRYTIESFNLKIGGKEYPVTEHDHYTQIVRHLKLENLNYPLDAFPQSKLVFSYKLSFTQYFSEYMKCVSTHSGWLWQWWDLLFNSDFKACVDKAYGAWWKTKYHSIDITDSLVKAVSSAASNLNDDTETVYDDALLKYSFLLHYFEDNFQSVTKSKSLLPEHKQFIVTYGAATHDYFHESPNLILEAYDRLQLIKNFVKTLHAAFTSEMNLSGSYDGEFEHLYKEVKSFESKNCVDDLANNLPITMDDENPRLSLSAKNYATKICRYNPISFNHSAAIPPAKHAGSDLDLTSSAFLPYAFCDKYTCMIYISETHYYRMFLSARKENNDILNFWVRPILEHLRLNSRAPENLSKCVDYCSIDDIDLMQSAIKELVQTISELGFLRSYQVIEYKK